MQAPSLFSQAPTWIPVANPVLIHASSCDCPLVHASVVVEAMYLLDTPSEPNNKRGVNSHPFLLVNHSNCSDRLFSNGRVSLVRVAVHAVVRVGGV